MEKKKKDSVSRAASNANRSVRTVGERDVVEWLRVFYSCIYCVNRKIDKTESSERRRRIRSKNKRIPKEKEN